MSMNCRCPVCGAVTVIPGTSGNVVMTCQKCRSTSGGHGALVTVTGGAASPSGSGRVWVGDPAAETISEAPPPAAAPAPRQAIVVTPTVPATPAAPQGKSEVPPASGADAAWVQAEAERFRQFVEQEWDKLKKARHMIVGMEAQAQMALGNRQMELNRLDARLVARQAELDRRQEAVTAVEGTLWPREEEIARQTEAVRRREDAVHSLESRRGALEKEVADLARLVSDLRPVVDQLQSRRDELTATRTELAARQSEIDRRFVEVGRAEVALHARQQEMEEWEAKLREEFDARERELARQRAAWNEELKGSRRERGLPSAADISLG